MAVQNRGARRITDLVYLGGVSEASSRQGLRGYALRYQVVAAGKFVGRGLDHGGAVAREGFAAARCVLVYGYDGDWATNMPFADFLAEDALFADTHGGGPIPSEHGGPLRLVVPRLYAWKSAKWSKESSS